MGPPKKIIWTLTAQSDLKEGFEFVGLENPRAAREWADHMVESVQKLARFPEVGRVIPEIGHSRYRELIVGEYRILHEVAKEEIRILRVFHSRRLFPRD